MSTRAPIARSRPPRGVHHLIAQCTPTLATRLPSADPSSTLSSSGRSTPRTGRCGRRCRRPESPRIPSARITVADEGNRPPKRVWGAAFSQGSWPTCQVHPNRSIRCRQRASQPVSTGQSSSIPSNSIESTCGAAVPANDTHILDRRAIPLGAPEH